MGIAAARNALFSLRASKPRLHADAGLKEASDLASWRVEKSMDALEASIGRSEEQGVGHETTSLLPLAFVGAGNTARIEKVCGGEQMHHHLENLGFVEGACVKVVSETAGNLIVEVKGAQVALDRHVALKIKMLL